MSDGKCFSRGLLFHRAPPPPQLVPDSCFLIPQSRGGPSKIHFERVTKSQESLSMIVQFAETRDPSRRMMFLVACRHGPLVSATRFFLAS